MFVELLGFVGFCWVLANLTGQAGQADRFTSSYFSASKCILNSNSFGGQTPSQFVSIKKPFETSFHRPSPVTLNLIAFN